MKIGISLDKNAWITSDSHFGHANIIKYCGRPYKTASDMNEDMIKQWNNMIGKDDFVIHLGDVSFNPDRYVPRLNGRILLVRGNHDDRRFNYLYEGVVESLPLEIDEFNCYLTHIPIDLEGQYKKGQEPDFTILDRYNFVICGHVHNKWTVKDKNINVGWDIWRKPLRVDELAKFLRSSKIDGHSIL